MRAAVAAALVCGASGCAPLSGSGRAADEHIARNKAILDRLPTVPGARLISVSSEPISPEGGTDQPSSPGIASTATYRVASATRPSRVADFYDQRLEPAWRCRRDQLALVGPDARPSRRHRRNGPILVTCTRGPALLVIDTAGLFFPVARFEVGVDVTGAARERSGAR